MIGAAARPRYKGNMHTAIHECGHFIADLALNELGPHGITILPGYITCDPGFIDSKGRVRTSVAYPGSFVATVGTLYEYEAIGTFAGPVAECRILFNAMPDSMDELRAINDRLGAIEGTRLRGGPFVGDIEKVTWQSEAIAKWRRNGNQRDELESLLDYARSIVQVEWQGIERMGARLLREGRMTGEAFRDAWHRVRASQTMRDFRARQCDANYPAPVPPPPGPWPAQHIAELEALAGGAPVLALAA